MSRNKKKTRPDAATSRRAKQEKHCTSDDSQFKFTTADRITQAGRVSKLLFIGREWAITGGELVQLLELNDLRELTQMIEAERRAGIPICASTDSAAPGYFIASGPDELQAYISSLDRRLHNIRQTRQHLEDTLCRLTSQERIDGGV